MIRLLYVTFFVLLVIVGNAQNVISGTVQLEDNSSASGAFVSLVLMDSLTMKKFTAADGDGKWKILNIPQGDYYLNVRYLGCKELFYPVSVKPDDSLNVSLRLETDAMLLQGVEVKGDAIGVTRSGDTLKYNLKYFSSGTEVSLGDVLNQLPGLEVDENGTVNYAGEKVDKLLVHGKDILNSKHKLATETIRADQLSGVHLIEDYRDSKDIETKKSGEIALDVRVKKSEQEKWSGQLQAFVGYDKKWSIDCGAFKIGEKLGATIFAKANNTGEQAMSVQDYFGIKGMQLMRKMKSYGELDDLFPENFRIAPQTTKNLDAVMAGSLDHDFNKKHSIMGDVILAQLNRDEQISFNRDYLASPDQWSGQELTESAQPILSGKILSENKFNKQLFIAAGLGANYEKLDDNKFITGLYNAQTMDLTNSQANEQWGFTPEVKIKYFPSQKIHATWQASYENSHKSNVLSITDITSFLDLNLMSQNGHYSFGQTLKNHSHKLVSFADLTYDLKHAWYWGVEVKNEMGSYQKTYSAPSSLPFSGMTQLTQNLNTYKLKFVLDTSTWLIKTGLSLMDNRVKLGADQEKQPLKLRPNLTLKYMFNRLHFVMFTLKMDEEVIAPHYGGEILEITDSRQRKSYDIDWQNSSTHASYALSYMNFNLGHGRMIYALVNYSTILNPIGTNVINYPDFTQVEFIRLPQQKSITARLMFKDRILKKLFANVTYRFMDVMGSSANQSEIASFRQTRHHFKIECSSKWKKKINYKAGYSLTLTRQKFQNLSSTSQFLYYAPNIELSYGDKSGFLWKNKLSYRQSVSQSTSAENWKLDVDVTYKKKKSHWRYFIKGRNLLNLIPNKQINVRFNPTFIEEISYNNFPGYVQLGISREF